MRMFIIFFALFSGLSQYAFAESAIKKGLWEVTTQMEMQGLPLQLPAVTTKQCFDKDQYVPKSAQQDENCTVSQKQGKENTISWSVVCNNERGELKGNGEITYNGDTFDGFSKMILINKEGQLTMDSTMKGLYRGACE